MRELRIATRGSALALAQANMVGASLERAYPDLRAVLVEVKTSGDLDQRTPVATLTETGAFVRAVQQAVLNGTADCAVHSCKDLPTAGPDELVSVYPERGAVADVLCGARLDRLPPGARVGTGSPRRTAQLRALRPDVEIDDIRGNVDTRLEKVESGLFDAVVLAEAGLERLGRRGSITQIFSTREMVPAPAQGSIAIEVPDGSEAARVVAPLSDEATRRAVEAERLLLSMTGAGCRSALGALALSDDGRLEMFGFVEDDRGPRRARVSGSGPQEVAERMAAALGLLA